MGAEACAACGAPVPQASRWWLEVLPYCSRDCAPVGAHGPEGRLKRPPRRRGDPPRAPWCRTCQREAVLHADSRHLYNGRDFGPVWQCAGCAEWVGCHEGSTSPLGRLCGPRIRELRKRAHAAFDPLWAAKMRRDGCSKTVARNAAYAWLAAKLGIDVARCHMSWMSDDDLSRAVEICSDPRRW